MNHNTTALFVGVVSTKRSMLHLRITTLPQGEREKRIIIIHTTTNQLHYSYSIESMSLTELMRNALVLARNLDTDVFNALNIMENEQVWFFLHHSICAAAL